MGRGIIDIALAALDNLGMPVVDEVVVPPRPERRLALPQRFRIGRVGRALAGWVCGDGAAWRHQSMALDAFARGEDVVMTTATASGKSLVFQAAGASLMEDDSEARILVFYPLKALAGDQHVSWEKMLQRSGFPAGSVAEITGDVPVPKRAALLADARVVAMTPDVCHAWLMSNLRDKRIREFVANVRLLVLDEAHVLESVLGGSVALLLRRLMNAQALCGGGHMRIIAASATMRDPAGHMHRLTGREFRVVGEEDEGSPLYGRRILHVEASSDAVSDMTGTFRAIVDSRVPGSFIAFCDSRMGVERLVMAADLPGVRPYRNGYEMSDRGAIEGALRDGTLKGVVSTSALEMGIDISNFAVGLNIGIPPSRRSLRQRAGRVGRIGPGAFALLAERKEFVRFGETFRDFVTGEVEPCTLYVGNRFLQFAHARCLQLELAALKADAPAPGIAWPQGFEEARRMAALGEDLPESHEKIARLGGDKPHLNYALRDVGDERGTIVCMPEGRVVGRTTVRNALREAYPGGAYLHMARVYDVVGWGGDARGGGEIRVVPAEKFRRTTPIIRTQVRFGLGQDGLIDGRLRAGRDGFLAECRLRIIERVDGYRQGDVEFLYKDLMRENPAMRPKARSFETTGVVMWFRDDAAFGGGLRPVEARREMARALTAKLRRACAVLRQDVDRAVEGIALETPAEVRRLEGAIVVFDSTHGSLRLTEPLFGALEEYLRDLYKGARETEGPRSLVEADRVAGMLRWLASLRPATAGDVLTDARLWGRNPPMAGPIRVWAPGSKLENISGRGAGMEVEIVSAAMRGLGDERRVIYVCRGKGLPEAGIPFESNELEDFFGNASQAMWNPLTNQYEALAED